MSNTTATTAMSDLLWVLESPSLLNECDIPVDRVQIAQWGIKNAADALPDLEAFLEERYNHRVGYYFESLVEFWLTRIRNVEFVGRRMQIREGKQTLGELDFLYRDEAGLLTHMETAVKFFLHAPGFEHCGSEFIGPNSADNFERKTNRLFDHQLPISHKIRSDIDVRTAFVKGRIFYHPDVNSPTSLPTRLSADHLKGTWIRFSELDWLRQSYHRNLFKILRKPYWLSDLLIQANSDLANTNTLQELTGVLEAHFAKSDHPNLISILQPAERDGDYFEVDRLFVVSDTWPGAPKDAV